MAVRATSSYNTRSNSYSRPSTTQKSSAPSKTSTTKPSSPSSSKAPTPAPKRDTFTYSSPAAKASAAASKTTTTSKPNTASKTTTTTKPTTTSKPNTAPKTTTTTKPTTTSKPNTASKTTTTTKPTTTSKPNTSSKTTTTNNTTETNNKSTSNTTNSSNKLTNEEYSQLAAKAAGVAIGSNGKPAFTSYEQSMKYAEALTNLHKSGINKNSTPQEIAAASVGTTVNKNGTPNISSVSQGQGYGSALKNLKSNPQPNVNQNSNGTKPNNTGSGNNTSNKANANTTGSTKPSSSANANRPANSTNSMSSSNKFTNEEYSQLAAQVTGVAIDPKGRPVFSSYEESMKYAEALTNLHKSGINRNSTPFEIASASVGAKNGIPVFNPSQLLNYGRALGNLLKGTQQGVSSVDTVPTGAAPTNSTQTIGSDKYSKFDEEEVANAVAILASKNTDVEIDSKGNPISNNQADKKKFWDEYYRLKENEDKIIAAAAANVSVNQNGEPKIIHGYEATAYTNAYNEYRVKKLGVDLSTLQFGENSTVNTAELTKAKPYTVVPDDSPYAGRPGYITQTAYNTIVYTLVHEVSDTKNSNAEMFATASALLNAIENPTCFAKSIYGSSTSERISGFKNHNGLNPDDIGNFDPVDVERATEIANYVVTTGNRAFGGDVCYWVGNSGYLSEIGGDVSNAYTRFSTTFNETSKYE